jgi:hypothetical protein
MKTLILSVVMLLSMTACALAQCPTQATGPIVNPKNACFPISVDHAIVDGYKLQINKADGTQVSKTDIGKPTATAGVIAVTNFAGFTSIPANTCTSTAPCTLKTIAYIGTNEAPDGSSVGFFNLAAPGTAVVY